MKTYLVRLDVSQLNSESFEQWSEEGTPEGVTCHGLGLQYASEVELWTVPGESEEAVEEVVLHHIGSWAVSILTIREGSL